MNNSPSKSAQYLACLLFFASQLWPVSSFAVDVSKVWGDVQSGKSIVILRHALAPGTGDPANFDVTRCETQRNLSDEGIQQQPKSP